MRRILFTLFLCMFMNMITVHLHLLAVFFFGIKWHDSVTVLWSLHYNPLIHPGIYWHFFFFLVLFAGKVKVFVTPCVPLHVFKHGNNDFILVSRVGLGWGLKFYDSYSFGFGAWLLSISSETIYTQFQLSFDSLVGIVFYWFIYRKLL